MERNDIVYSNTYTKEEFFYTIKVLGSYIGIVALWIISAKLYMNWGRKWVIPAVSVMWILGAFAAWKIPEQKEHTIKETKFAILGYTAFLLLYRWAIQKIAPVTTAQMGAALDISVATASGMAAAGLLQNMLIMVSVMTPLGYCIWLGQKFKAYRGKNSKQAELNRLKGTVYNRRRR